MNIRSFAIVLFVVFVHAVFSSAAYAQPALTPDAAKSFLDFYYNGQGTGIVLADTKICTQIEENECVDTQSPIALQNGETYYYWMMFVVPQGDDIDGVLVQFNQNGVTRSTREVSISGSIRYRTWKSFTPNRAGNWEIVVLHDTGSAVRNVKTQIVTVNE